MPDTEVGGKLKKFPPKKLSLKTLPLRKRFIAAIVLFGAVLGFAAAYKAADMTVSGWFYQRENGFYLADQPFFLFMHWVACFWARALGVFLACAALYAGFVKRRLFGVDAKGWLFLFLALVIGPGLIANVGLKDHWGRARPREIIDFGGHETFSPTLEPQVVKHKNGSFVAGDAAFGFFLPAFAYVVPIERKRKLSRAIFWGCIAAGGLFGLTRIVMGAHFFSDVLFAAFFMLLATAVLHAAMFGKKRTAIYWREWFFDERKIS